MESVVEALLNGAVGRKEMGFSERKGDIRASDACDCRRMLAYEVFGFKVPPLSAHSRMRLDDGHMHHEELQQRLSEIFKLTEVETELIKEVRLKGYPRFTIVGHSDGVIEPKKRKKKDVVRDLRRVVEIKGVNHFAFIRMKKQGVRKSYIIQNLIYQYLLGIKGGVLLVKNKNTTEFWEVEVPWDAKKVIWQLKRWGKLMTCIKARKLPRRDFTIDAPECGWCPYLLRCWKGKQRRPGPSGKKEVIVDMSPNKPHSQKLVKLGQKLNKLKDSLKAKEAEKDQIRALLLHQLERYKATSLAIGDKRIHRKLCEREVPDKVAITRLIAAGVIQVTESSYYQVGFEVVKPKKGKK